MDSRIRAFDNVFRERLLVRLSGVGPDQDPDLYREMLAEFLIPPLIRQTNRHHLLPTAKLEQWWAAAAEEKDAIMEEYEAGKAAAEAAARAAAWAAAWAAVAVAEDTEDTEYKDDLPEDDEERNGELYFEDFDEVAAIFLE